MDQYQMKERDALAEKIYLELLRNKKVDSWEFDAKECVNTAFYLANEFMKARGENPTND